MNAQGLVRFCTVPYSPPSASNMSCAFMHITNYAVNKTNINFIQNNSKKPTTFLPQTPSATSSSGGGGSSNSNGSAPSSVSNDSSDNDGSNGDGDNSNNAEAEEENKSHKRSLTWLWNWMHENGMDRCTVSIF